MCQNLSRIIIDTGQNVKNRLTSVYLYSFWRMADSTNIPARKRYLADLGLFYSAAVWGSTFFLVKGALDNIDPVVLVAGRFLLAGMIMLIYLLATGRPVLAGLRQGAFLGFIIWALYISQTIGLGITTASNSGFITGLFVAFVPLFSLTLFRRKPTVMELIATAVSLVGLWILTGGLTDINTGDMLTLIAAFTYALHVLYSDKYMKAGFDPLVLSCQQFLFVGILSLLTAIVLDLPLSLGGTATIATIVFLGLFPTLSAFVIQLVSQKIRPPLRVSLIFALEPVFAGVFAWTIGGEIFKTHTAIGGLFIFAALVISGIPVKSIKK